MLRLMIALFALAVTSAIALAQPPGRRAESPASAAIPPSREAQRFPEALVNAGATVFAAQCGFCHGRDARGGSGGADLTRSMLVAEDLGGDRIGPVVRDGRIDAGMPAFAAIAASELESIVAFIHEQKTLAESEEGGRQAVAVEDLLTGDVRRGRRYFDENCTSCHAVDGDLAGIASRMEGLRLLQRMLYPQAGGSGGGSSRGRTTVVVTAPDGSRERGELVFRDEFVVALRDSAGQYRSFPIAGNEVVIDDPLDGHRALLERYTDRDMHDLITYLHTLQ